MQRTLALSLLVLLALGFASQIRAEYITCPNCESNEHTWTHYFHYECPYGGHQGWDERAESPTGNPPPVQRNCPDCGWLVDGEYCYCNVCPVSQFWP
jgi:RNA polymerase subunit RPABC4/transcription elongation factor Spt4